MDAKHTPAPWRHYDDSDTANRRHEIVAMGKTVAHIYCTKGMEAEDAANGRLIAAAPALLASERENLAVLENLLAYLRKHDVVLPPMSRASLEVRIEKTSTIIAKAEGRPNA